MKRIVLIISFLILQAGCNNENNIPRKQESGLKNPPGRIISLAPAITEELYLLGADKLLVANTYYCKRPEDAARKRKIGNLKNFDVELILELEPDVILCTTLANRNKINKLKQLGIRIVEFPPPGSYKEICENFLHLGESIGKKETAREIIEKYNNKTNQIRELTGHLPDKKIFMQIGANPLVTVHREYFINDYIKYSGGINISREAVSNLYSREQVVFADPDFIIIVNMGIASEDEKKIWLRFDTITAVKNGNIYIVDSDIFCNPTISTFYESLRNLTLILHPELEKRI
jgi:iron complex transport system substrate-binding protein